MGCRAVGPDADGVVVRFPVLLTWVGRAEGGGCSGDVAVALPRQLLRLLRPTATAAALSPVWVAQAPGLGAE